MELKINRLTKQYKDKLAVDNVSLKLTPGIWGLLGANGAGKTTMMRMVAGILKPTSGGVFYDGLSIDDLGESYRDIFGYLPQTFGFYPEFTVKSYLEYMSALKGIGKKDASLTIERLLQMLALSDVKNKKIRRLSGGMQRRVGIAQALLNDPEILILDEPTSGLDPGERVRFRNILAEFAKERIILISTHIVSDVENIATRNAVMKDGRIIAAGSTDALVDVMKGRVWRTEVSESDLFKCERLVRIANIRSESGGRVSLRY
ncbi:MAG: ABC transporter ATP-binding protein, partial [Eubacterium callanderi]